MALPNADKAIIPLEKLREYILNPNHPKGKHKARAIRNATGLEAKDGEWIRNQIRAQIPQTIVFDQRVTSFGIGYNIVVSISGPLGTLTVQTRWIVKEGDHVPRFTTLIPRPPRSGSDDG